MRSRLNFVCYPKQAVQTLPQERKKKKKKAIKRQEKNREQLYSCCSIGRTGKLGGWRL